MYNIQVYGNLLASGEYYSLYILLTGEDVSCNLSKPPCIYPCGAKPIKGSSVQH